MDLDGVTFEFLPCNARWWGRTFIRYPHEQKVKILLIQKGRYIDNSSRLSFIQ